jgi:hypothetical protein
MSKIITFQKIHLSPSSEKLRRRTWFSPLETSDLRRWNSSAGEKTFGTGIRNNIFIKREKKEE